MSVLDNDICDNVFYCKNLWKGAPIVEFLTDK